MPWTKTDYPQSMKNLASQVREKAIEVANALVEDGYDEGRAIPIAISQAKKWVENGSKESDEHNLHVVTHPDGWAVRRANAKRASFVFEAQSEAQDKAVSMAQDDSVNVIIHGQDGKIEDQLSFGD